LSPAVPLVPLRKFHRACRVCCSELGARNLSPSSDDIMCRDSHLLIHATFESSSVNGWVHEILTKSRGDLIMLCLKTHQLPTSRAVCFKNSLQSDQRWLLCALDHPVLVLLIIIFDFECAIFPLCHSRSSPVLAREVIHWFLLVSSPGFTIEILARNGRLTG